MRSIKHELESYFEGMYLEINQRAAKLNWEEYENCEDHFERSERYLNHHSNSIEMLICRY